MEKQRFFSTRSLSIFTLLLLPVITNFFSCYYQRIRREIRTVSQFGRLNRSSPYLKLHMHDGKVYVLSKWHTQEENESVSGKGELLDLNREIIKEGEFTIPLSNIALAETNVLSGSKATLAVGLLFIPSSLASFYCLANPKACYGSCPTFYAWDGNTMALMAEGFSASVSPILEAQDIDALYHAKPRSQDFKLRVTNEALETHVIRHANILAVRRPKKGRIFATASGEFRLVTGIHEPKTCLATEGDCLNAIRSFDGQERFSKTDPRNLAEKETIDLEFPPLEGKRLGIVLGFRQTLLTTYLFYQGLAYMGNSSGYWLAELERSDETTRQYSNSLGEVLGGIELFARDEKEAWTKIDEITETGPIAADIHMIPLPKAESGFTQFRLRLTKGMWRVDYIALAELGDRVDSIRISPSIVLKDGIQDPQSQKHLIHPDKVVILMPGDKYDLVYALPRDFQNYELFLESQGYYLEWMRPNWLKEENLKRTFMMFANPKRFLKVIAPEFKKVESHMEETFWRSKYVQK